MHRFHLAPSQCAGDTLTLREAEAHHALHVLRVRPGQRAVVLDGAGQELLCDVVALDRHTVGLQVRQRHRAPPVARPVTLVPAVAKGRAMEWMVQKATELGVHRIVPVGSERSVAQVAPDEAADKVKRWESLAIEALKQCGSPWLPQIEPPRSVAACLAQGALAELTLVASLQDDRRHPRQYFGQFQTERGRAPRSVAVWIGPEGDFTPAELHAIKGAGALPITLGPLVLRSETAAIYALSVVNYELQAP